MNQYFDIGANLTHPHFKNDLESVLYNAIEEGINKISITGSNIEESVQALKIAKKWPKLLISSCGIHPHEAKKYNYSSLSEIKDLSQNNQVCSIGETGLDYHRTYSSPKDQKKSFEGHVELAIELNMPLFLHVREAHDDFIAILDNAKDKLPKVVVHCFTGLKTELDDYIERNFFIGITGWICDERRGKHLKQLINNIPINKLLIETDSPFLLPRNSGIKHTKRNEPMYLSIIANEVARNRQEQNEDVFQRIFENSKNFFGLV